jgi:hypothetical protein
LQKKKNIRRTVNADQSTLRTAPPIQHLPGTFFFAIGHSTEHGKFLKRPGSRFNVQNGQFSQGFDTSQDANTHGERQFPAAMSRADNCLNNRTQDTGTDAYPTDGIEGAGHA